MAWVRIDDHLCDHPKFKLAWELEPASVGLELFALSHSAAFLTDGVIDERFVRSWFPRSPVRRRHVVDVLVRCNLWVPNGTGWVIHDWLDYNEPRTTIVQRRQAREAKRRRNRRRLDEGRP